MIIISEERHAEVEKCCSLVESVLMDSKECWDGNILLDSLSMDPPEQHRHDAPETTPIIDWEKLPESLHPSSVHCELNQVRAKHKQAQIDALVRLVLPMVDQLSERLLDRRVHVVDFGAGSGHLGLVVAHLRRETCTVTLLERKEYACRQAQRRAADANLEDNVIIAQQSIHEFGHHHNISSLDLGISLHSCGVLTDAALTLCLLHRAAFCLCPCCYGQTATHLPTNYLPRSRVLRSLRGRMSAVPSSSSAFNNNNTETPSTKARQQPRRRRRRRRKTNETLFYTVARSADCTSAVTGIITTETDNNRDSLSSFVDTPNFCLAKRCMRLVDADRLLWVAEQDPGYYAHLQMTSLQPLSVTPKNNVILGMPMTPTTTTTTTTKSTRTVHEDDDDDDDSTAATVVDLTALVASAGENADAEAGEKQKTGRDGFQHHPDDDDDDDDDDRSMRRWSSSSPRIRTIYRCKQERLEDDEKGKRNSSISKNKKMLPCAFHIAEAFAMADLERLDALRTKIPLDMSRPTCPRRFLTEKKSCETNDDDNASSSSSRQQHQEDGWVGELIDATLASWNLPHPLQSLPWYRYLEYTEAGGHMDKHTDGSNVHPTTGARSVATMLIYLSTCRRGGATTLYHKNKKKNGKQSGNQQHQSIGDDDDVIESILPVYNTVLIFPHGWQHSGDPVVVDDPKIVLRADLAWKEE